MTYCDREVGKSILRFSRIYTSPPPCENSVYVHMYGFVPLCRLEGWTDVIHIRYLDLYVVNMNILVQKI
jgi:hypothetical protein